MYSIHWQWQKLFFAGCVGQLPAAYAGLPWRGALAAGDLVQED